MQDSYPTYRLTDPATSRQPVHDKPRLKATALAAIAQHPGITAGSLGDVTHIDGIWKRLPELERDGLIVRGAPTWYPGTGRYQTTWRIAERQLELSQSQMELIESAIGNGGVPWQRKLSSTHSLVAP